MPSFHLLRHPASPVGADFRIDGEIDRAGEAVSVLFRIEGPMARLGWQKDRTGRGERLWERTCLEVFLGPVGSPAYLEYNFSPSGAWDVHAFRSTRDGGRLEGAEGTPATTVALTPEELRLEVRLLPGGFAEDWITRDLRIGLSAVLEETERLSWWALAHADTRPDFHREEGFRLVLPVPPGRTPG